VPSGSSFIAIERSQKLAIIVTMVSVDSTGLVKPSETFMK
jgi:hypothetical protein